LVDAAAKTWNIPAEEITTEAGMLFHNTSGKKAGYGEVASLAATLPVPDEVTLKEVKDFSIIGSSKKNVEGHKIVTGKPLFTMDHHQEGMLIAMIAHPPAFGLKLKSVDDAEVRSMPGIKDVFVIKTLADDYERNAFDTTTFTELVVIAGNTTWEVMNARRALKITWEPISESTIVVQGWGGKQNVRIPAGLENTAVHKTRMDEWSKKPGSILRRDGDPESAFK